MQQWAFRLAFHQLLAMIAEKSENILDEPGTPIMQKSRSWKLNGQICWVNLDKGWIYAHYMTKTTKAGREGLTIIFPRELGESGLFLHTCTRCGHQWISRKPHPISCSNPKCRSRYWNRLRKGEDFDETKFPDVMYEPIAKKISIAYHTLIYFLKELYQAELENIEDAGLDTYDIEQLLGCLESYGKLIPPP